MADRDKKFEQTLGAAIRALRLDRRLTQLELAERANVSLGAVKNLESGRGSTTTTLVRVVHAFGQDSWLELLRPVRSSFNPLDLADQRRRSGQAGPRRVRRTVTS